MSRLEMGEDLKLFSKVCGCLSAMSRIISKLLKNASFGTIFCYCDVIKFVVARQGGVFTKAARAKSRCEWKEQQFA